MAGSEKCSYVPSRLGGEARKFAFLLHEQEFQEHEDDVYQGFERLEHPQRVELLCFQRNVQGIFGIGCLWLSENSISSWNRAPWRIAGHERYELFIRL